MSGDLELSLARRDADNYRIDLRFSQPGDAGMDSCKPTIEPHRAGEEPRASLSWIYHLCYDVNIIHYSTSP